MITTQQLEDLISMNEAIISKSMNKVKESFESGMWDCECFDTLNDSIENLVYLNKIEKYINSEEEEQPVKATMYLEKMQDENMTDFKKTIYMIAEKLKGKEGMIKLTDTISEVVEDMKIINPRLYNILMKKLRELGK